MWCVNLVGGLVLSFGTFIVWWQWEWVASSSGESGSTILRNLGLVYGGFIAIWIAYWRGVVADRQAEASHLQAQSSLEQAKAAQDQAETSQRGITNERYQRSAEMLGSSVLAVRLGGMYALRRVAEEEPGPFHLQIMRVLCAFVRNPTPAKNEKETDEMPTVKTIREDVQVALWMIAFRSKVGIELEKKDGVVLDLCSADLSDVDIGFGNLTHCILRNADLTNTVLYKVEGLAQHELDLARADPARPPDLKGARDAETGKRLKWTKGRPSG